jgi:uncharacterized protein YbcV (DUF1398 family)
MGIFSFSRIQQIRFSSNKARMFTLEQIKAAHSKVKSGADFPAYIQDIKKMGVTHYDTLVSNGNADYFGADGAVVSTGAKYETLTVSDTADAEQFKADLKAHQYGKTDYPTFCEDCAKSGIEKWVIYLDKMTCTYYDKAGNEVLVEVIPH